MTRKKTSSIGILGEGADTPREVIVSGLQDIYTSDVRIHVPWVGKPIPADMEIVYDWLLDYEVPFTIYSPDVSTIPAAFRKATFGEAEEAADPSIAVAKASQTILYLWSDEERSQAELNHVLNCDQSVSLILDLTNALVSIDVEEAIDEPASTKYDDVIEDDDEDEDFISQMTREELEAMPAMSVRRYAKAKLGQDFSSKQSAIDALFDTRQSVDEEDPTDDAPVVDAPPPASESDKERAFAAVSTLLSIVDSLDQTMETQQAHIRIIEASLWLIRLLGD